LNKGDEVNNLSQKQMALFLFGFLAANFASAQVARSDSALRKFWMTKLNEILPAVNDKVTEYEGVADSNAHPACKVTVTATTLKDPQFDEYWQADHLSEPRHSITQSYAAEISVKAQGGEYRKVMSFEIGTGNKYALSGPAKSYQFIRAVGESYYYGQPEKSANSLTVGALKGSPSEPNAVLVLNPGFTRRAITFAKNKDKKFTVTIEADGDGGGNSHTCILNENKDDF
jgi:hypothetical protein